jgi:hypothetical protein
MRCCSVQHHTQCIRSVSLVSARSDHVSSWRKVRYPARIGQRHTLQQPRGCSLRFQTRACSPSSSCGSPMSREPRRYRRSRLGTTNCSFVRLQWRKYRHCTSRDTFHRSQDQNCRRSDQLHMARMQHRKRVRLYCRRDVRANTRRRMRALPLFRLYGHPTSLECIRCTSRYLVLR